MIAMRRGQDAVAIDLTDTGLRVRFDAQVLYIDQAGIMVVARQTADGWKFSAEHPSAPRRRSTDAFAAAPAGALQ